MQSWYTAILTFIVYAFFLMLLHNISTSHLQIVVNGILNNTDVKRNGA